MTVIRAVLIAMACLGALSAPALAFDSATCKQHCATNCSGKGNYCLVR